MNNPAPKTIYLKDYTAPEFAIIDTYLNFELHHDYTRVKSKLQMEAVSGASSLVLHGEQQKLISVKIDGKALSESEYELTQTNLSIPGLSNKFTLEIETEIKPQENKSGEGLYHSGNIFCTQCEPEGFRKITYFLDRSDVMSVYTTRIEADKAEFPTLLSNGNKIDSGELDDGRHFVVWNDPFKKPSYLFALVAGDLGLVTDEFVTRSGRKIALEIYVDPGNEDRSQYALDSLKRAMKWDEDVFGLEYDLDIYMIVAVDAFNMGAMENKGLNVFNTTCALANTKTATDANFQRVEGVIGHEYFHNWTGNRVTCRDWFQLTLKEGLTVFRDQEFSSDMTSRPVIRIEEVRALRNAQFAEDSGPTAHPIKPPSFIEINNFYTSTVYNKGAEVIRMIHTLIGKENFRKGIDKYFDLFDGQAVTTEDFVHAMELASGADLTQFQDTWYHQAGTPQVDITTNYDEGGQRYSITVRQSCRPTAECGEKKPYHLPIRFGLLNADGNDLELGLDVDYLNVTKAEETFVFENVPVKPIPSFLRDFSAPVVLNYEYTQDELIFLLAHDSDAFNRYEAGQRLATIELEANIARHQNGETMSINKDAIDAFGTMLRDTELDDALKAEAMVLPTLTTLTERMDVCDFDAAFAAREFMRTEIARAHEQLFQEIYSSRIDFEGEYSVDAESVGRRSLQNRALAYLSMLEQDMIFGDLVAQYNKATSMTDEMAAFAILCQYDRPERREVIQQFYDKWSEDALVMNKWFAVQAGAKLPNVLDEVKKLEKSPAYDAMNPNKIRSLLGAFAGNLIAFHDASGSGYEFMAGKILEIDVYNAQIAARLARCFSKYARLDEGRKALLKIQLERILAVKTLSRDVYEIVSKTLESA